MAVVCNQHQPKVWPTWIVHCILTHKFDWVDDKFISAVHVIASSPELAKATAEKYLRHTWPEPLKDVEVAHLYSTGAITLT